MAVLTDTDRWRVWAYAMRTEFGSLGITKSDLRAAIDAIDDWTEENSESYFLSLPEAFRSNTTGAQQLLLFCFIVMRRAGLLRVEEDA